jgi:hypothetical protein
LSFVFFTDRDLGLEFPKILASTGLTVERHRDHFEPACPDEVWLEAIGRRGWVALTHNSRIRYTPNELKAVSRHGVPLLVIVGKTTFPELAHSFVATRSRVEAFLTRTHPPFIAKVYRASPSELAANPAAPGRVELWYPK